MLPIERRKDILNLIMKDGSVKADELAEKYSVGVPTIRRDLKYLAGEYGVELMYGGAYIGESGMGQNIQEISILQKKRANMDEKRVIAQKAAQLIQEGDTVALNAGSTVELILDYINPSMHINIITLTIHVAFRASSMPNVTIYMPGGRLRNMSGALVGGEGSEYLKKFHVDKAFMGALAVSIDKGVTHTSIDEIRTNQILMDISSKCYLAADSSKFDKVSFVHLFELSCFEGFITDGSLPQVYRDYARAHGIEII